MNKTIIIKGCAHCGGDLLPDASEQVIDGPLLRCLQCSRPAVALDATAAETLRQEHLSDRKSERQSHRKAVAVH